MTTLEAVQTEVQRVAQAIAAAIGLEVEIVDEELTTVGGTGQYRDRIGQKRLKGYFYDRILTTGQHYIVSEPSREPLYTSPVRTTEETAEVCCPIRLDEKIIGIIGLVAFDQSQRGRILAASDQMLTFIQRMGDLLAGRVLADQARAKLTQSSSQLAAIIGSMHDGVLSVNGLGEVTHCNAAAMKILGLEQAVLVGRPITGVLPGSGIAEVIATGQGYVEREEVLRLDGNPLHLVVTATPIGGPNSQSGAVAVFRDIGQVRRLVYNFALETQVQSFENLIGVSPLLREVIDQAHRIAGAPGTVLITGESGTGKDVLARAIHHAGPRRRGPFLAVNCGALPEQLMESELFGYSAGAFTGARRDGKPGKFELAHGGTLFLDEIGDLPLHLQVKLLHVLQRREVERVGGTRPISVDVRMVAATNRDLEAMVRDGQFRADLFFRLHVIPLQMPSLRERPEDIPVLLDHFLSLHAKRLGRSRLAVSAAVREAFFQYAWPGNVRELENAVEYLVSVAVTERIGLENLPPWLLRSQVRRHPAYADGADSLDSGGTLEERIARMERRVLADSLTTHGRDAAALERIGRELGLSRATLYRKLRTHHLL